MKQNETTPEVEKSTQQLKIVTTQLQCILTLCMLLFIIGLIKREQTPEVLAVIFISSVIEHVFKYKETRTKKELFFALFWSILTLAAFWGYLFNIE